MRLLMPKSMTFVRSKTTHCFLFGDGLRILILLKWKNAVVVLCFHFHYRAMILFFFSLSIPYLHALYIVAHHIHIWLAAEKNSGNAQKLKYILMPYKMRYAGWVERRKKCCLTDVDYQVCWHIECVLLRRGFFMLLSELGLNLNISKGLHNKFHSFLSDFASSQPAREVENNNSESKFSYTGCVENHTRSIRNSWRGKTTHIHILFPQGKSRFKFHMLRFMLEATKLGWRKFSLSLLRNKRGNLNNIQNFRRGKTFRKGFKTLIKIRKKLLLSALWRKQK